MSRAAQHAAEGPDRPLGRRTVLLGAAAFVTAACTGGADPDRPDARAPAPTPDPDEVIKAGAVAEIRLLVATYDAQIAAYPRLSPRLAALRAEHLAHLGALGAPTAPATPTPSAAPSAGISPKPAPARSAAGVPALLAARESAAAQARLGQVARASGPLARLLAGIGASEASHAALLRGGSW